MPVSVVLALPALEVKFNALVSVPVASGTSETMAVQLQLAGRVATQLSTTT